MLLPVALWTAVATTQQTTPCVSLFAGLISLPCLRYKWKKHGESDLEQSLQADREFGGRGFSAGEIDLIKQITSDFASLSITELANTLCELLEWKRPNGKLKFLECRAFLEQLQANGVVTLPALQETAPRRPRSIAISAGSDPKPPLQGCVTDYMPLSLQLVPAGAACLSSLWNEFIERYHYLGYRVPFGASLRYLVQSERCPDQYLACLLFSSPAWTMAPRDSWIGWNHEIRKRNLQYVVCNSRFLILPWVTVRDLASKILSLAASRLPEDWECVYGYRPLLLETLVDPSRFRGTCYRAANWIHIGKTQGRGRMDRHHALHGRGVKDIYVFPLCRNCRKRLLQAASPNIVDLAGPQERV